jgi:hypothetical protein
MLFQARQSYPDGTAQRIHVPNGVRDGRIEPYRFSGDVAQLARAPRLQRGGRGFEPHRLHFHVCWVCATAKGCKVKKRVLVDDEVSRLIDTFRLLRGADLPS